MSDASSTGVSSYTNGVSNWYVADEGGKLTVVDAGVPADWKRLLRALGDRGLPLSAVDCVILTHAHSDHTGFAERARTEAGASARVHSADLAVAKGAAAGKNEGGVVRHLIHAEMYRTVFGILRGGGMRIVPLVEAITFEDGEVLDVPGRPSVVHVPGHTSGSCALWFERRAAVCTGDALVTRNPLTGRRGPQIMPSAFNRDSTQALQSLERLLETRATLLFPGHGDAWNQGVESAIDAARRAGRS